MQAFNLGMCPSAWVCGQSVDGNEFQEPRDVYLLQREEEAVSWSSDTTRTEGSSRGKPHTHASETNAPVFKLKVPGSDITQEMARERETARNAESHRIQLVQINAIKTMLMALQDGLEQLQLK